MTTAPQGDQEFCDWCYGPMSPRSQQRSRWLGLTSEDAWACEGCIAAGRYRVPPDGWLGPVETWLAADQYVLDDGDRLAVLNALNEVLNGPEAVSAPEFQTRMGVTRPEAYATWLRLGGHGIA